MPAGVYPPREGHLRCAYLVSRYPAITHTFILHEVRAVRARGVEVQTVSIRRVGPEELLSPADEEEYRSTRALLPVSPMRLLRDHLYAIRRGPGAYLAVLWRACRLGSGGARATLWQLFYFAESILLWTWLEGQGLRHVHVHFANVASDVAMLATAFGNRTRREGDHYSWSLTVHGPTELLDVTAHRLPAKLADATAVISVSDFALGQLRAATASNHWAKLRTARCGVDVDAFQPPGRRPGTEEGTEILTVAAMSRRKGHIDLLAAVAELHARGIRARLTLVGEGPERAAIERETARLRLGTTVRFEGAVGQDRIAAYYRAAHVFCLASYSEGIPVVLMEAMASGLPVVATHVMGIPELVEDGRSGILVPPARPDALADALERLAENAELREQMGAAGRSRVEEAFELGQAAAAVEQMLCEVIR